MRVNAHRAEMGLGTNTGEPRGLVKTFTTLHRTASSALGRSGAVVASFSCTGCNGIRNEREKKPFEATKKKHVRTFRAFREL